MADELLHHAEAYLAYLTVSSQYTAFALGLLLPPALLFLLFTLVSVCRGRAIPVARSDLRPRIVGGKVATTALARPDRPGFIQCYNPATLTFLGEIPVATAAQVQETVATGRRLQAKWAATTFAERRRVLECLKRSILAQSDDIVRLSCIDTGKPRVDAQFGEILSSCGKLAWVIAEGERVLAPEPRATNLTSLHKRARVEYSPLGVVGVIAPWNYPFYNMMNHVASALFAGNAVVLKMSEYSAWSGAALVEVARDALRECGHEPNLVQLVQGFGETGAALVGAADKVIFTGSPGVGRAVMAGASRTLTPLVLELGGKDPFIVCDDADADAALALALRGTFQNAGQNCVGIERVLVYESLHDAFVAKAAAAVRALRVGPPLLEHASPATFCRPAGLRFEYAPGVDVGCITTAPQLALIGALVDDAVARGATLHCGGRALFAPLPADAAASAATAAAASAAAPAPGSASTSAASASASSASAASPRVRAGRSTSPAAAAKRVRGASAAAKAAAAVAAPLSSLPSPPPPAAAAAGPLSGGLFFAPTLLSGVTSDMRIAGEEVFGPVMTVFKVPGDSDDAAVALANGTAYGLGATVFSASPARANRIAARLRCGMVGVNAFGLNYLVQSLPFGGVGASGFDRFSGAEGLRACCLAKSVVTDLFSSFSIPTPVPRPLQYPVTAAAPAFTDALIALQFAPTLWQRFVGLLAMAGLPVAVRYQ